MTRRFALLSSLSSAALFGCSPAGLLNGFSRLAGDSARLAAAGVRFGDDPRLTLDVWVPPERSSASLPIVVFFYGGGWVSGERADYGFVGRAFAARGFVTVIPDYRLIPQVRFPAFVEDGAKALKWTRDRVAEFGGDPARINISGHSAGSYIGAMLSLDRHFLTNAGIDPAIVCAAALMSGPYDFYPFTEQRGRNALGHWPRPLETQPIKFVRRDAPPMLLMHGAADTVVRPRNSQRLAAALTAAGAQADLKLYPCKSHVDTIKSISPLFRGSTAALADSVAFFSAHDRRMARTSSRLNPLQALPT